MLFGWGTAVIIISFIVISLLTVFYKSSGKTYNGNNIVLRGFLSDHQFDTFQPEIKDYIKVALIALLFRVICLIISAFIMRSYVEEEPLSLDKFLNEWIK